MAEQFWNAEKTSQSLAVLKSLPKKLGFVLIGGWAVYSYVNMQKSEDVDITIDPDKLDLFRKYGISEYGGTSIKYSVIDGTTIDLFINGYTDKDLPVPISTIMESYVIIDGIKVVERELLLLLKLWGYFGHDETKIRKDIIDVVALTFYANIDFKKFNKYIEDYKVSRRRSSDALLEYLDKGESMWEYVTSSKNEFDELRGRYKRVLRELFGYK